MSDNLLRFPEAIRLSRRTVANMRQNIVIALITVAALLAGVLFDEVTMAIGMLVHQLSILIVIVNGMRLLRTPRTERAAQAESDDDALLKATLTTAQPEEGPTSERM